MSYIYDLADTWNDGATTFTSIKMNVTDTASNAASLLLDLQVGGTSRFSVRKDGVVNTSGSLTAAGISATASGSGVIQLAGLATYGVHMARDYVVSWGNNATLNGSLDLMMGRRAAANLRLGAADAAAPVAQTLSVQSVVAGTSNTAGANLTITGSQGTGTGAGGSIIFQVAPAGSSGTAQNALATALTINSAGTATFNGVVTANSGFSSGANILLSTNGGQLYFGSGNDLILARDAADTLALRNGANAQTFRVYNTTDGTNGEWLSVQFSSNLARIGTNSAGTGVARELLFGVGGGSQWALNTSGHLITYGSDNTYDIGTSGGSRPRSIYLAANVYVGDAANGVLLTTGDIRAAGTGVIGFRSRGYIKAPVNSVFTLYNENADNFDRLQFGGTTSSFPALKRSSTTLQARLADDSAFAPVQGKLTTDTAYAAGDPTTTGYLVVYDSTGTAYKIPAVAV